MPVEQVAGSREQALTRRQPLLFARYGNLLAHSGAFPLDRGVTGQYLSYNGTDRYHKSAVLSRTIDGPIKEENSMSTALALSETPAAAPNPSGSATLFSPY